MGYREYSLTEFVDDLASAKPAPGGGGASAFVGALAISLGNMVGELTLGKKKYASVEDQIKELMERADGIQKELLELIDQDAVCFLPLAKAYGIPKDDPSRSQVMEEALKTACQAPMDIMKACTKTIDVIDGFANLGSKIAISDAGCGAILAKSAMEAAILNIYINAKSMTDRDYAKQLVDQAEGLLDKYGQKAQLIYTKVVEGIR